MYRIGLGYDLHQLCEGRDLIIGGIKIPHTKGLLGHSVPLPIATFTPPAKSKSISLLWSPIVKVSSFEIP